MSGKPRFTPQEVCDALTATRGMMGHAARRLGCSHETIANYRRRYPSVREVLETQRGELVDLAEFRLAEAIERGEAWAIRLCLTTLGKDRGYVAHQERTGAGGQGRAVVLRWEEGRRDTPMSAEHPHEH